MSIWDTITKYKLYGFYKQQKLIFHSSGDQQVQDQDASRFRVWGGIPSFIDGAF
jgi:hypothetical protein